MTEIKLFFKKFADEQKYATYPLALSEDRRSSFNAQIGCSTERHITCAHKKVKIVSYEKFKAHARVYK